MSGMNDAQRARLASLRDYGRITGAEVAVHTITPDGHVTEEEQPDPAPPSDALRAEE